MITMHIQADSNKVHLHKYCTSIKTWCSFSVLEYFHCLLLLLPLNYVLFTSLVCINETIKDEGMSLSLLTFHNQ